MLGGNQELEVIGKVPVVCFMLLTSKHAFHVSSGSLFKILSGLTKVIQWVMVFRFTLVVGPK